MRPYLLLAAAAALAMAEFIPTNEWQEITDDSNIPGGLDVQLNMENGKRFARLPQDAETNLEARPPAVIPKASGASGASGAQEIGNLDAFEDLAHDIDHGEEIIRNYFLTLNDISQFKDEKADQAAKVIQTALRQNPAAIKTALELKPSYPSQLVGDLSSLTWRKLGILGSLASTPEGARACSPQLEKIRENLDNFKWDSKIGKRIESILTDLKHMNFPLDNWVNSLQETLAKNGIDNGSQLYQLKTLKSLMDLEAFTPNQNFMQWLSGLATQKITRDSTHWDLVEYAKSIRHTVFGNKFAERVKADL